MIIFISIYHRVTRAIEWRGVALVSFSATKQTVTTLQKNIYIISSCVGYHRQKLIEIGLAFEPRKRNRHSYFQINNISMYSVDYLDFNST